MAGSLVYFASAEGGPVKIGFSKNPSRRMAQLVCPVTGLRPRVFNTVSGRFWEERFFHERYARFAIQQQTTVGRFRSPIVRPTEWFRLDADALYEVIHMTTGRMVELIVDRRLASERPVRIRELLDRLSA